MKKSFQSISKQDQSVNLIELEKLVFSEFGGVIYIGGEKITEQVLGVLREQVKYLKTSNLFEILNATAINEAASLAMKADTLEHLQFAKALQYWNKIFNKLINALDK